MRSTKHEQTKGLATDSEDSPQLSDTRFRRLRSASVTMTDNIDITENPHLISLVIRTLSPVNHKGLYLGYKQTSNRLIVILHISHQTMNSRKSTKSVLSQIHTKQNTYTHKNTKHIFFSLEELVPSILPLLKKKGHKTRTRLYRGPFRRFIITRFFKV